MSKWFYYNASGEKIEVTGGQLKGLAKAGMITPETIVETEKGKTATAGQVKGLTFIEPVQAAPKPAPPSPAKQTPAVPEQPGDLSQYDFSQQQPNDFPQWDFSQEITQSQTVQSQTAQTYSPPANRPARSRRSGGYDYDRIAAARRLAAVALSLYTIMLIVSNVFGRIFRNMAGSLADLELNGVTVVTTEIAAKMPSVSASTVKLWLICLIVMGLVSLGVVCFSIVCTVRLARAINYGVFMTILMAICFFIPVVAYCSVGFVILLILYFRAGQILNGT